jgi:hypothetical protein
MHGDYVYPSIYFAYFFFAVMAGLALYFLLRSRRDGYWGKQGEDIKYRMMEDDEPRQDSGPGPLPNGRGSVWKRAEPRP